MAVLSHIDALYNDAQNPSSGISQLYDAATMPGVLPGAGGPTQAQLNSDRIIQRGRNAGAISAAGPQYNVSPAQQAYMDAVTRMNWSQGSGFDKFMSIVTPLVTAAGIGGAFAPAVAGAVGAEAGSIGAGAIQGGITGASGAGLTGQNVGKGALMGAVGGGLAAAASPAATSLTNSGVNSTVANGLVKAGTGALTGAIGGEVSGRGALAGAEGGALSGAGGAAGGAIAGSIFNSGDTIPTSNTTDISGTSSMSVDPSYFDFGSVSPQPVDTGFGGGYNPVGDPNSGLFSGGTGLPGSTDPTAWDALGGLNPNYQVSNSFLNAGTGGSAAGGLGSQAGSSLLGGLAKLLSGGAGGAISPAMMQSLLGTLASGGASFLNSNAARSAAGNFANQTKYAPYSINGPQGSTTFNGTTATSTLSPQEQAIQKMLAGVAGNSGAALNAGPGAAISSNFNNLQSADLQAQQRLLGNTQDNEFANGVLGSTAGGYQTQGALQAIGAQTGQNYNTAVNEANTQQQQQLAQLTQSLNGMGNIDQQQLQQLLAGFTGGTGASYANRSAYSPSLAANSNTPIGTLLGTLGNQASTTPFVNPTGP